MIKETIEVDEREVEINLETFQSIILRWRMPSGIGERVAENQIESQDIRWFNDVVELSTELDPEQISNIDTMYIVDSTARLMEDGEVRSYEEFTGVEEEDFSEGLFDVKND